MLGFAWSATAEALQPNTKGQCTEVTGLQGSFLWIFLCIKSSSSFSTSTQALPFRTDILRYPYVLAHCFS